MNNKGDIFEYQEFFINHNNSIVKFTVCKTNQEILIKSNKYEAKFNHQKIENLTNMKFDTIEKEYNYFVNLFQQNSILIKNITINISMTISFIQNSKMRDIILLYNNENKSIFHYEFNFEFRNLMNDIAQIKKDVHEIHNAIHNNNNINQNKNIDNKNNIFGCDTKENQVYKNFVIDNTLKMLNSQIENQNNYFNELEKKSNEYQESAKNVLKEGDKEKCKRILFKRKKCVEKMKTIEGIVAFIEEQKMTLENTKQMNELYRTIENNIKVIKEEVKTMDKDKLELMKEEMEELKADQEDLNDFLKNFSDEDDNKEEEKGEDKKEEKVEGKKEEQKKEKKEIKKDEKGEAKKEDKIEETQSIEYNEKKFEKYKEEGFNSIKEGVLAVIFANQGFNFEEIKRIKEQLDDIKGKQDELNDFFKNYIDEEVEEN